MKPFSRNNLFIWMIILLLVASSVWAGPILLQQPIHRGTALAGSAANNKFYQVGSPAWIGKSDYIRLNQFAAPAYLFQKESREFPYSAGREAWHGTSVDYNNAGLFRIGGQVASVLSDGGNYEAAKGFSLNYGQQFFPNFTAGIATQYIQSGDTNTVNSHAQAIQRFKMDKSIWEFFGFYDLSVALNLHYQASDSNQFNSGFATSFLIFKHNYFQLAFHLDTTIIGEFGKAPIAQGFELFAWEYAFFQYGFYSLDFFETSGRYFGGGLRFKAYRWDVLAFANFSDSHFLNRPYDLYEDDMSAGLQATMYFPASIRAQRKEVAEKLYAFYEPSDRLISPNNDGKRENLEIYLNSTKYKYLNDWKVVVRNQAGETVDEIYPSLFQRNELNQFVFPEKIIWNGKTLDNKIAPDGEYTMTLELLLTDNTKKTKSLENVSVSSLPPEVNFVINSKINRDDYFILTANCKTDKLNHINIKFLNSEQKTVLRTKLPINSGKQNYRFPDPVRGESLPRYRPLRIEITGKDGFENGFKKDITGVMLAPEAKDKAFIRFNQDAFSPNGDKINDFLVVNIENAAMANIENWKLNLVSLETKTTNAIQGKTFLPKRFKWGGKDEKKKPLPDGHYFAYLSIYYQDKNQRRSETQPFIIDRKPAKVNLELAPKADFTPDGDNQNDVLQIIPTVRDLSEIQSYRLEVLDGKKTVYSKTGDGQVPIKFYWDGKPNREEHTSWRLQSYQKYKIQLSTIDKAGNKGTSKAATFTTGAIFDEVKTEKPVAGKFSQRKSVIQLPNITFAPGTARLGKDAQVILKRIAGIALRHRGLKLTINGHTDDVGKEEFNRKLSEKRAIAVADSLEKYGVGILRLKTKGFGESRPIVPNTSNYNRSLNRRVEIEVQ